jgi:hypothetical protein
MVRDGFRDRDRVARHAGDERGAPDVVAIELHDPAIAELGGRARRIPLQAERDLVRAAGVGREQLEETRREEMAMRVVDHAMTDGRWPMADSR